MAQNILGSNIFCFFPYVRVIRTTRSRDGRAGGSSASNNDQGNDAAFDEGSGAARNAADVDDDGGGSSDEGEGDGDTVAQQAQSRHAQDREYEEAEEEELPAALSGSSRSDPLMPQSLSRAHVYAQVCVSGSAGKYASAKTVLRTKKKVDAVVVFAFSIIA